MELNTKKKLLGLYDDVNQCIFLTQVSAPLNFNETLGSPREPYNLQDKKISYYVNLGKEVLSQRKGSTYLRTSKGDSKTDIQNTDKR